MKFCGLPVAVSALLFFILEVAPAQAVTFPIRGRPRAAAPNGLARRADMTGSFNNGSTGLADQGDTEYTCNITLGGQQFQVLIDTGSSDLWVAGNVPGTTNLSIPASVTYAKGEAAGFVNTATLVFDDITVDNQAYINVPADDTNPAGQGLIGLGPSASSNVLSAVKSSAGNTVLDRIFIQNTSTPNFISVILSRDTGDNLGVTPTDGQLTVGDIIPGFENVTNQVHLPALVDQYHIQHWQTTLDSNGILGPDGQPINTTTTIPDVSNTSQLHVVFDTGFTMPQVPQNVADAIYGRIPGANFIQGTDTPGYWRYPCNYEVNLTFLFAGVRYPIHPLDVSFQDTDSNGNVLGCGATFQQISPSVADHANFGAFDAILGMAFLRNAYLMINFGDFVDGSNSSVASPYMQLLSTTDPASAHKDFVNARLGGVDTTGSQAALLPANEGQTSPNTGTVLTSVENSVDSKKKLYIIIGAVAGGVLLLALVCAFAVRGCRRRRRANARSGPGGRFVAAMPGMRSYQPLHDPRPESPVWEHGAAREVPTYGAGYAEPNYRY